jgi:hypothetical protein
MMIFSIKPATIFACHVSKLGTQKKNTKKHLYVIIFPLKTTRKVRANAACHHHRGKVFLWFRALLEVTATSGQGSQALNNGSSPPETMRKSRG